MSIVSTIVTPLDTMDVRGLHRSFQSQILAEMDARLALVIAAFNSRRRVECTGSSLRDFFINIFLSLRRQIGV